ncbi:MAG: glycosyltransferase family 4 protein [Azospirillaceae bacterium]
MRAILALPGDPETRTGGYLYDRRIRQGLEAAGWRVDLARLGDGFPAAGAAVRESATARLAALPEGVPVIVDGLAGGVLPEGVVAAAARGPVVYLCHHALADETGVAPADRDRLVDSERRALKAAHRIVVTAPATRRRLETAFGVPAGRIAVIEPGTDPAPIAPGTGDPPVLLCVASLTPRKGHAILIEALSGLADRPWRLVLVGGDHHDPACAADIGDRIARAGLGDRITLTGELSGEALDKRYAEADLFVLPSYLEGYGMVLAEALARGLPIVSTKAGAIPDTVPADAGVLVEPGDAEALRAALAPLIEDPRARARLAAGARSARGRLPDWPAQARRFAELLHALPETAG